MRQPGARFCKNQTFEAFSGLISKSKSSSTNSGLSMEFRSTQSNSDVKLLRIRPFDCLIQADNPEMTKKYEGSESVYDWKQLSPWRHKSPVRARLNWPKAAIKSISGDQKLQVLFNPKKSALTVMVAGRVCRCSRGWTAREIRVE